MEPRRNQAHYPAVLSQWSCLDSANLPSVVCDKYEELPIGEAHGGLGFQGFNWESVMQTWSILVTDLSYSTPALLFSAEIILIQCDLGDTVWYQENKNSSP